MKKTKNKSKLKFLRNIIIVAILLTIILIILKIAPNYVVNENYSVTNLLINNNNITTSLKNDMIIEDGIIYLSKSDIYNFFDPYIYYDEKNERIITTYDTKVAAMTLNNTTAIINGSETKLSAAPKMVDNILYLPFSSLNSVYDVEIANHTETNIVTLDSLGREQIKATSSKKLSVKGKARTLSKTVASIDKGESVIVIFTNSEGWAKIRTADGILGFVKEKHLTNFITVREDREDTFKKIDGKISLVWDYYNNYDAIPNRTGTTLEGVNVVCPSLFVLERLGKGEIYDKAGPNALKYIEWAKSNGYQVWGLVGNDTMIQTTSEIMNSFEYRSDLIENIVDLAIKYNLDGINIDFEYMYDKDIDLFTQFLVELHPRLKEYCITLSVDVTAPDGGENWSTCYNRNEIADNCDYIIFMAYDQYGESSTKAGTTAGYDWMKVNLNKFLTTEEIDPDKIILGLPFYTRMWKTYSNGKVESSVINMKDIDDTIPSNVEKTWLDDVKQNYIEYKRGNITFQMWIEDVDSMREKLSLVTENNLAGAAFWEIGRDDSSIWPVIIDALNTN